MAITIALGGDTMLGRGVGEEIAAAAAHEAYRPSGLSGLFGLFGEEVRRAFAGADLRVVNLECCVSRRGRAPDIPGHPFHFRAPPEAVEVLTGLGVDCVTLANNHAMDYGTDALERHAGAPGEVRGTCGGRRPRRRRARSPAVLTVRDASVAVFGVTDHPAEYAAGEHRTGVAYAPLACGVPAWLARPDTGGQGPVRRGPGDPALGSQHDDGTARLRTRGRGRLPRRRARPLWPVTRPTSFMA